MDSESYFLKKGKIFIVMMVSLAFVVGTLLILRLSPDEIASHRRLNDPTTMYIISLVGLGLFGSILLLTSSKFFTFSPAVKIDEQGISGNIFGLTQDYIPWQEVSRISDFERFGESYIAVFVKAPEAYLDQGNWLRKKIRKRNFKMFGTPILISTGMIRCEHKALLKQINEALLQR